MKKLVLTALCLAAPSVARAQTTTTTYTYDALGRLIVSDTSSSTAPSKTTITYDAAGNRKVYSVTGSTKGSDNGLGASVPNQMRLIVVPLNGFTLIPIG